MKLDAQNYPLHQSLAESIKKQRKNEDFTICKLSWHQNDDYDIILSNYDAIKFFSISQNF